MKKLPAHILRIGLGLTFLWIGVLIYRQPLVWGSYLQPWAAKLLPLPLVPLMLANAVVDMAIGILLLCNALVWLVALVAVLQLAMILTVSGITDITIRDVGLLAGALALMFNNWPKNLKK